MNTLWTVIVIIGMLALCAISAWCLGRESGRVHGRLNKFMAQAKSAKSVDELVRLQKSLTAYSIQNCWHRHFVAHAEKVSAYISGRLHQ